MVGIHNCVRPLEITPPFQTEPVDREKFAVRCTIVALAAMELRRTETYWPQDPVIGLREGSAHRVGGGVGCQHEVVGIVGQG